MKFMKWYTLWITVLFVITGCVSTTYFNKTYMPKAVPDKPENKITMTSEDSQIVSKYLSQTRLTNHVGLYWLTEDVIYLSLADGAIFSINTQTKSIQQQQDPEANEARQRIAQKVNISQNQEGRGVVRQFAASIFSYMGQNFEGDLTDNKHRIAVEAKTYEKRDASNFSRCESMKIKGQLTNSKGRKTDVEWDYDCAWVTQSVTLIKVPQLLSGLQVSPSGKYYLFGSLLYSVDANKLMSDVLKNYPGTLAVSVNPGWSKMAVLRGTGKTYWVEFFDFQTDDKRTPSSLRIDI